MTRILTNAEYIHGAKQDLANAIVQVSVLRQLGRNVLPIEDWIMLDLTLTRLQEALDLLAAVKVPVES